MHTHATSQGFCFITLLTHPLGLCKTTGVVYTCDTYGTVALRSSQWSVLLPIAKGSRWHGHTWDAVNHYT